MRIISDRRKNVSMAIRGKFGRNTDRVLALVTRTCKRLESRKGIAEKSGETRAIPTRAASLEGKLLRARRVSPRMWAILWSSILTSQTFGSLQACHGKRLARNLAGYETSHAAPCIRAQA